MSVSIDISGQFVWAIANSESNLAGDERIRPVHLLLGVLKVADEKFPVQVKGVNLSEEETKRLAQAGRQVRQFLEMKSEEITTLRRSIRTDIRQGRKPRSDAQLLHRSDEARQVFAGAAERAAKAGTSGVSIVHLLEALFDTGVVNIEKLEKIKNRVGSKGPRWEVAEDKRASSPEFAEWLGRNLTEIAFKKGLRPFVGRAQELKTLIRILSRTSQRNILLVGDGGVGKSALVEGLAQSLLTEAAPDSLKGIQILELHGSDIAAGCSSTADLERRLLKVLHITGRGQKNVLFIDDLNGLFPSHVDPSSPLAVLTTALSHDDLVCIATTTTRHHDQLRERAPAFCRRFQVVRLAEPTQADCREIAKEWAKHIGRVQGVSFAEDAIKAAMTFAGKVLGGRAMPDKVVDLLENAAAFVKVETLSSRRQASQKEKPTVGAAQIRAVLEDQYGLAPEAPNLGPV